MSHYTVVVVLPGEPKNDDDLNETLSVLLAPFDENVEVEPYVREDGDTSTYNPQSKWDWWTLGGRWTGFYSPKPNAERPTFTGSPGVFGGPAEDGKVDCIARGDVDEAAMLASNRRDDGAPPWQTYSVLAEGVWREPGEMGWFGMSTDTEDSRADYQDWYARFWAAMPPETYLAVVDVHI